MNGARGGAPWSAMELFKMGYAGDGVGWIADRGGVDELTKEFVAESLDGLDRMDRCLTELELRPGDAELLGEIFRAVHTIKGATGFLGFSRLEKLAHAGETLLVALRGGRLRATTQVVNVLLQLSDSLRLIVLGIDVTGDEGRSPGTDDRELIALMEALHRGEDGPATTVPKPGQAADANWSAGEKTLRMDVDVLDRMMNLVGDLVLTRNQILQSQILQSHVMQSQEEATSLSELARRLDSVTADLRETVMQARLQPVGYLFSRFPRMVRDTAQSCGKRVRLEFSGQETGLDKNLLEAVRDPLTHAVRNAIDHGIETPAARIAAGKPAEGRVSLRAYHHHGSVVIEVEDDGAGIATARVRAKAVERGLVTEERAAAMTEREVLQLVFEPGFSTAAEVTHVSGRGVGLDVVLANVEKAGGTVELQSRAARGTMVRIRVPLTLAIVRALVVRTGEYRICLPQSALAELVYVPWREAEESVAWMGTAELFRLRERLLPMVRLDRMLGLPESERPAHGFYLVVLEADGCQYGLVVDDLMAPEEIVVKPLSPVLRQIGLFAGATVLGSGALAMILDVSAAGVRAGVRPMAEQVAAELPEEVAARVSPSFLIFEERGARKALPLEDVVRIESVAVEVVEYAGEHPVLQYRGELLPLEDRGGVLRGLAAEEPATVLICQRPGVARMVGLVVRKVIEVATGDLLERNAEVCGERLARVRDRLTVVHEAFAA